MTERQDTNVNQWLVEQGWAFPTYYDSMSASEIEQLNKLTTEAKEKKAGVWKDASRTGRNSTPR